MRISTAYNFATLTNDLSQAQANYVNYQNILSTGKSINSMSDDPYTATLAINQTALQSQLNQYNKNLSYANSFLTLTDNALSSTADIINSAKSLAQQGANSSVDQTARSGMVNQINQMETELVSLANSQGPSGEYIFAGQVTQNTPYSVSAGALTYAGDTNPILVQTGPNTSLQVNTNASTLFTNLYSQLETLKNDLSSSNLSALSSVDLTNLQQSSTTILAERGNVGAAIQAVTTEQSNNQKRVTDLTKEVSNETDADYASTIVKYTSAQNAYQAALSVTSQAFKLSLLNFIQ